MKNKREKRIISYVLVGMWILGLILAQSGDYTFLVAIAVTTALSLIADRIVSNANYRERESVFLKSIEKPFSRICFLLFFGFLISIVVLRIL